jgi:hypothetical protein
VAACGLDATSAALREKTRAARLFVAERFAAGRAAGLRFDAGSAFLRGLLDLSDRFPLILLLAEVARLALPEVVGFVLRAFFILLDTPVVCAIACLELTPSSE